ncbi:MAG: HD domain-containing protein [Thermoleophilia bacterium]|nr:HD domain-containing protein [Thermoleophilia bacterium]
MTERAEAAVIARRGQQLTLALASAMRTAAYYDEGNVVMRQAVATLGRILAQCSMESGAVSVGVRSHCVFVDKVRVPTSVSTYERFTFLVQLFETWSVGEMTFCSGLTENELMRALMLLSRAQGVEGGPSLGALLSTQGVERIVVEEIVQATDRTRSVGPGPLEVSAIVAYSAAMQLGGELGKVAGSIEPGMVRRVRHVTQAVVDEIIRDPGSVLSLTTIRDYDKYLVLHSTNVAVLSTVLGQRLGLSKARLGELCLAGFLHDAGKLGVDPDVLQKPGALDEREWEEMRRHPLLAAYALLGNQRLTASNMRAVVVAFEHHLNHDFSGYPSTEIKKTISLFGSIVSIADVFDALTTARVYRKVNFTPADAMVEVIKKAGTHFDSVLIKLFAEVMGLYPPGTVVVLTGGEAGVVCRPPAIGLPLDRPKVRVVIGEEPGAVRDLCERNGSGFARNILAVLNPSNQGQMPAVDPEVLRLLN